MSVYQIEGMKFSVADGDGPYEVQDGVTLMFPDEAEKALNKFLPKYDIDIELGFYFMDLEVKIWLVFVLQKSKILLVMLFSQEQTYRR